MSAGTVVEVAVDIFRIRGTDVSCYLLREADALTLVDACWPGDLPTVEAAITALGHRPADIRAVLLTHAHIDHVGAVNHLHDRYCVPCFAGGVEVGHAHRDRLEQAEPADIARTLMGDLTRPRLLASGLAWTARIARAGALRPWSGPNVRPLPAGVEDLPGRPVPVPMPGHTSGHIAYLLPAADAVLTGDGLVTAHPLLEGFGPQLLPDVFQHGDALAGLAAVEGLPAGLLLPGHGDPLRIPIRDAVRSARIRAGLRP